MSSWLSRSSDDERCDIADKICRVLVRAQEREDRVYGVSIDLDRAADFVVAHDWLIKVFAELDRGYKPNQLSDDEMYSAYRNFLSPKLRGEHMWINEMKIFLERIIPISQSAEDFLSRFGDLIFRMGSRTLEIKSSADGIAREWPEKWKARMEERAEIERRWNKYDRRFR